MTGRDATEAMLLIKSLDRTATLKLSDYTRKWYVEARIEISDGVMLTGITEHRPTPDAAIAAFLDRLTSVSLFPGGRRIVVGAYSDERRAWVWNGGGFVEVDESNTPSSSAATTRTPTP